MFVCQKSIGSPGQHQRVDVDPVPTSTGETHGESPPSRLYNLHERNLTRNKINLIKAMSNLATNPINWLDEKGVYFCILIIEKKH